MVRSPLFAPAFAGALVAAGCLLLPRAAAAQEKLLHIGATAGFTTVALPSLSTGGYGGGGLVTYGISDAFNLRLHGDVSIFELPEADSLLLGSGALGAEYLVDILDWVPYVGAMVGATHAGFQASGGRWLLAAELPFGLGYRLLPEVMVAAEGRAKWMFLGDEASPQTQLWLALRFEYVWEHP